MHSTWRCCLHLQPRRCVLPRAVRCIGMLTTSHGQAELLAAYVSSRRVRGRALLVLSPLFLWVGVMSLIPHKEERFAYVVYPQARARGRAAQRR